MCKKVDTSACKSTRISLGTKPGFCANCILDPERTKGWIVDDLTNPRPPSEFLMSTVWSAATKHATMGIDIDHVSDTGRLWAENTLCTPERRQLAEAILDTLLQQFWYKLKHPGTTEVPTLEERKFILQLRTSIEASEIALLEQRVQKFERELVVPDIAELGDNLCAICHQDLGEDYQSKVTGQPVKIPCNHGHNFHEQCILQWLYTGQYSCPTDRDPLTPVQMKIDIKDYLPGEIESGICPFITRELSRTHEYRAAAQPQYLMTFYRPGGFSNEETSGVQQRLHESFETLDQLRIRLQQQQQEFHDSEIELRARFERDRNENRERVAESARVDGTSRTTNGRHRLDGLGEVFIASAAPNTQQNLVEVIQFPREELEREDQETIRDETVEVIWAEFEAGARLHLAHLAHWIGNNSDASRQQHTGTESLDHEADDAGMEEHADRI